MNEMQGRQMDDFFRFFREITSTTELEPLYRKIVEHAKEILGLDFSTLMLLNEDKSELIVRDTVGFPESYVGTFSLTEGQGLSTHVITAKRPETVSDFNTETRFSVPPIVFEKHIRSAICVPMMLEGEPFGVLIGHVLQRREFSADELLVYQNMGNLAAIAIRNATNMLMLRRARDEWKMTFDAVPDKIAIIDDQYRIVRMNRTMAEDLGISEEDAVGEVCYKVVHKTEKAPSFCPHTIMLGDGMERTSEIFEESSGKYFLVSVTPYFNEKGKPGGSIHIARDITTQKAAQLEAENERAFLQTIIDGIADPVMVINSSYQVQLMNRAAREKSSRGSPGTGAQFCYQISHQSCAPCSGQEHPCPLRAAAEQQQPITVTHKHKGRDGEEFVVEILASPIFDEIGCVSGIIEISRDITEKIRLEELKDRLGTKVAQQQKEESILTLAAGIAHDFNNILMSVLGNAELLKLRLGKSEKELALAENIVQSSERMAALTSQLLAYARGGMYRQQVMPVEKAIREALSMVHKGNALKAVIDLDLPGDLWPVDADPGQLNQALMNLFTNAFEAMEQTGGRLTVQAFNETIDAAWECSTFRHEHPAGEYIHLVITDSGPGIARDLHLRIFDPFFSTKFIGRGLGLAAAAGIIQSHKGCISVQSDQGKGTAFHIHLPRSVGDVSQTAAGLSGEKDSASAILVVDDEPQITTLLNEMLSHFGYRVVAAASGSEALDLFRKEKEAITLAILDIQMPGMSGRDLFKELKALKPGLKVIISSGYDEKVALAGMDAVSPDGFIKKPFRVELLQKKIREILET
ncbi:MAG: PAS domain-containing protein [Nitrospirae bacterium]|nr:PAS domain-containing protein [Nitrospirota bacterium]